MDRKELIRKIGDAEKRLSKRQIEFAEEYIRTGNGIDAAKNIGFRSSLAERRAFDFLRNEDVSEYITLREKLVAGDLGVSRRKLAADLIKIKDRCMAAKPVMTRDPETKKMVESGEWAFDASGALRAIDKLTMLMETESAGVQTETRRGPSLEEREIILRGIAEEFGAGESGD